MHSTISASLSTNTIGSTKAFVSFSSNSIFKQQKGASYSEKVKSNILHLSTNLHRFTGLDTIWHNFSVVFRLIQTFCIFLIPRCKIFWNMNLSTSFFNYLLKIPIHLCFAPSDTKYHLYFLILLFLFFLISDIFILVIISRNTSQYSISNSIILFISIFCSVLTPIFTCFIFTLFGYNLNVFVFMGNKDTDIIVSIVFGALSIVLSLGSHYFSCYILEGTSIINFSSLFIPWAPYTTKYAHFNTLIFILGFLGEFLPVERKYYQIAFSIVALIIANPFTISYLFINPIFQNLNDNVYLATTLTVNMISVILMDLRFVTTKLTPIILFVCVIVFFSVFLIIYRYVVRRIINHYSKRLYAVYKHSRPFLPVTTPLVFTTPMPNQILLSKDAYSVMQAFSSLGISTVREYHYFIFVGAYMKMAAIKNLDFIKWGLNYFHDVNTLIICTQICQYFNDRSQTQAVLIQKLNEIEDLSFFMTPIIYNLVLYHSDVVSDKSAFLKKLLKKAHGGLVRCRRNLSIFWGSVLKHSSNQMMESLCKLRDSISETQTHFDELTRCYPFSMDAMSLYLSFMTEISGEYIKCNKYINKMSAKFIEMKSDALDNDDSCDGMSILLNDHDRHFSPYISKLTQYLDQESQCKERIKCPIFSIWCLGIISSLTLIICLIIIMIVTLVSFNEYPKLLYIVNSADDVFIEFSSLILGARRICLYASGALDYNSIIHPNDTGTSVYDHPNFLLPWMIERGEKLPSLIMRFYKNLTSNLEMLQACAKSSRKLRIFSSELDGKLTYIIDMIAMSIRNIAVNIPSYFNNASSIQTFSINGMQKDKQKSKNILNDDDDYDFFDDHERIENYTGICNSSEMYLLIENIEATSSLCDDFISEFRKISERKVRSLSKVLFYSMIFFPVVYIVIFGLILLLILVSLQQDIRFRLTLFLSLPEQVASEIYNSGGNSITTSIRQLHDSSENSSHENNEPISNEIESPEKVRMKEKVMRIESLHQFSTIKHFITDTGIKEYVISCSIFILIAALSIFILTYYSRSVNETFISRSYMLCASALRYSSTSYASLFVEESFFTGQVAVLNESEIIRLASKFLSKAQQFHVYCTQGSDDISLTYLEYSKIQDLMLNEVSMEIPDILTIEKSYSLLRHEGYMGDSGDTFMRLFIASSFGMLETYKKNPKYYELNGNTWQYYNHLIVSHLLSYLETATALYLNSVSDVIDQSFSIALIVSLIFVIFLLFLFIGPILSSSLAISNFFSTMMHTLCQVPPEVFTRSFYINRWLKGQISKSNYKKYETTFTRNISRDFQKKLIQESSEKLIVFDSNGEYIDTPSVDVSDLKEKTLPNVLNIVLNSADISIIDSIQKAFDRFQDAKDKIDNIAIVVQLSNKKFVKITVTGIQLSYLSSSVSSNQKYYSYIIILMSDFTQEANIENIYETEKEKTIDLLKRVVPQEFALRIHEGEEFISFVSTIGTVMSVTIDQYNECLESTDFQLISEIMVKIRTSIYESLSEFQNVSLISFSGGEILFVAGLFNDEQNGSTEATDTFQFAFKLNQLLTEIIYNYNLKMTLKYGVATGGPIFCKVIGNDSPRCIVFGDTVKISQKLDSFCSAGNLFFERTTFECLSHLNLLSQEIGELEHQGRKNLYYSVSFNGNI